MPRPRTSAPKWRVTFELDPALVARLNALADRLGVTRTRLVEDALERYLSHNLTVEPEHPRHGEGRSTP